MFAPRIGEPARPLPCERRRLELRHRRRASMRHASRRIRYRSAAHQAGSRCALHQALLEEHRWWWRGLAGGVVIGIRVLTSFHRSKMSVEESMLHVARVLAAWREAALLLDVWRRRFSVWLRLQWRRSEDEAVHAS